MRVCMILEGSYPFVNGGVSSWMHQYIQAMPEVDFVLWCVGAKAEERDHFKYQLPPNVVEVHQVFLDDALKQNIKNRKVQLTEDEIKELHHLFDGSDVEWNVLFDMCRKKNFSPINMLGSHRFLDLLFGLCRKRYVNMPFTDFFHTIRSMLLPELYVLSGVVPKADIYHATATGYSGLLGSLAKYLYNKPFILTEHGIYTREREEELLRAKWVDSEYKQQWIDLFYQFSDCAYRYADKVTSLFARASRIQQELGCDKEKCRVIPNGIHYNRFCDIPMKEDNGFVDIGAIVRIARIKDIKTMLYAFLELHDRLPNTRLHIMGGVDDEEYLQECQELIEVNHMENVIFTGQVNVIEYMEKLDFTILTSISEGQPLSVLESMAAKRPVVVTDVGCCRELVEGELGDECGVAGYYVPPMHKSQLVQALYHMCADEEERLRMGENGQRRVYEFYTHKRSMEFYEALYGEVI